MSKKSNNVRASLKKIVKNVVLNGALKHYLAMLILVISLLFCNSQSIYNTHRLHDVINTGTGHGIEEYLKYEFVIMLSRCLILSSIDYVFSVVYINSFSLSLTDYLNMPYDSFKLLPQGKLSSMQYEKGEVGAKILYMTTLHVVESSSVVFTAVKSLFSYGYDPSFKFLLIFGILIHIFIFAVSSKTSNLHQKAYLKSKIKSASTVRNELRNFEIIKVFDLNKSSADHVSKSFNLRKIRFQALEIFKSLISCLYTLVEEFSFILPYWFFFYGNIKSNDLMRMGDLIRLLYENLRLFLRKINESRMFFVTFHHLESDIETNDKTRNYPLENIQEIKVENLTVETLFSNLSFEIHKNEKIAVVGANNSGKTTFMRTLVGLSDYQGRISINGIELDEISRKDLCSQISYVSQNIGYIQGTVMENLRYGNSLTEDEVVEKCKEFQVHEIFEGLEGGYNKISATVGTDLSGGQRQRVNVMRGILKNAPVLMVDECFSGISTHDKNLIIGKLLSLDDRTLIVATNDMDLLHKFDKILLLNGEKSAFGTFSDLKNVLVEQ